MPSQIVNRRAERKAKKSYTLSSDAVQFLERRRRERRSDSVSAVLEEIIQSARRESEFAAIEKSVSDYYSSLSDAELKEQREWGEFALTQFPDPETR